MEDDFIDNINNLYKNNNWYDILHLNVQTCNNSAHSLSWIWPSENNLKFVSNLTTKFNKEGVLSIGCGSGLFEWLLQKSTDSCIVHGEYSNLEYCKEIRQKPLPMLTCLECFILRATRESEDFFYEITGVSVTGIEIDQSWWSTKYSKNKYIPLKFVTMPPDPKIIRKDHALLFCYFNNAPAFKEYIHSYGGDLVFIIGPGKNRGTITNPEPFQPKFEDSKWRLLDYQEIKDTGDYIAAWGK